MPAQSLLSKCIIICDEILITTFWIGTLMRHKLNITLKLWFHRYVVHIITKVTK